MIMGIQEAYDEIKGMYDDMQFQLGNRRAIMTMNRHVFGMADAIVLSSSSRLLQVYRDNLSIIERNCPEVLKGKESDS